MPNSVKAGCSMIFANHVPRFPIFYIPSGNLSIFIIAMAADSYGPLAKRRLPSPAPVEDLDANDQPLLGRWTMSEVQFSFGHDEFPSTSPKYVVDYIYIYT